ncbi:MAG: 23S rRNA (guanosine(2251)-2'-O)-methyltransferase RlmB, partial [Verrucomicrobiales bacterium]
MPNPKFQRDRDRDRSGERRRKPPGGGERRGRREHEARENRHANLSSETSERPEGDLVPLIEGKPDAFVLILDCVQDPHNLGACLRSADAAGVDAVVLPKDKSAPLSDTTRRVACGAAESVPIFRVTNLARAMRDLQAAGLWLVGTSDAAEKSLYDTDLKGPLGIVMGGEGPGLRRLTQEHCDFLAMIPMRGSVECLNVSVATGVCLFEAVRQRGAGD